MSVVNVSECIDLDMMWEEASTSIYYVSCLSWKSSPQGRLLLTGLPTSVPTIVTGTGMAVAADEQRYPNPVKRIKTASVVGVTDDSSEHA